MARQFKRVYELTLIGDNDKKVISGLRIVFEVTKSLRGYPNLAKIDIYNPNEETIALLTTQDPLIVLNAGYENNIGLIFKGRIRNLFVNKLSTERIMTIYAGDGERNWQRATFNKTLSETVNIKEAVTQLFETFVSEGDVTIGPIEGLDISADKLLGQTLSGSTKDILDALAEDYDFNWSIQNGEIIAVQGSNKELDALTSVLVKQTTGMIGSPTVTEIGADVTTLLNPELLPNRLFTIESESAEIGLSNIQFRKLKRTVAEGNYRAFEVTYTGDTHSSQWISTAKGTLV